MVNKYKIQPKTFFIGVSCLYALSIVFLFVHERTIDTVACTSIRAMRATVQENTQKAVSKEIEATAFYVYDFTDDVVLLQKEQMKPLPLASLSKILVARMALARLGLEKTYTIEQSDLDRYGDTGFRLGETYTVSNLITAALVPSSNDGTAALMHAMGYRREEFAKVATARASELGFTSFSFQNSTGLDLDNNSPSNIGSAQDITHLLYTTWKKFPSVIERSTQVRTSITSVDGHVIEYDNTNVLAGTIPLLIASKTGYTQSAGGNLSVLWRTPDGKILGATLLGSSLEGRFSDMKRLIASGSLVASIYQNKTLLACN